MKRPVLSFVLLAFLLSYGFGFAAQWVIAVHGWDGSNSVIDFVPNFLVVLGPMIAAVIVVRRSGQSFADYLASDWRGMRPAWWWLTIPTFTLAVTMSAFYLAGVRISVEPAALPLLAGYYALHIFVIGALEEIGWRGWLLRERLATSTPLSATLTVALIWGVWHLPKLMSSLPFAAVFIGAVIVNSFLLTALWSRFRGRTALAAVAHGSFNAPIYFLAAQADDAQAATAFVYVVAAYAVIAVLVIAFTRDWWLAIPMPRNDQV